jgi:secondary thiamine-phosphate synthase enzyme
MTRAYNVEFKVRTNGKGTYEITQKIQEIVRQSQISNGLATIFIQHTSASLIIFENADPSARTDLEAFFEHLIPEETDYFTHTAEGSDDMPSHLRMTLTRTSESIPIVNGRLSLGIWQGVFVYEHRRHSHFRSIAVSIIGEVQ